MTPEQFCYWLQGRTELLPNQAPSAEEWAVIRDHLASVFVKQTPNIDQYRHILDAAQKQKYGPARSPFDIQPPPMYVTSPIHPDSPVC